jgi:cytochrome P450
VKVMHEMVATAIEARRKLQGSSSGDLLDHMLAAADPETGRQMTLDDLVYNMQFFIVAGHETTALAIAWALYLLANSPVEQEAAHRQARAQLGDG